MARDKQAVIWTRLCGNAVKMAELTVTNSQSRLSYEPDYLNTNLPGIGILYDPQLVRTDTVSWDRTAWFDLMPPIQSRIPPAAEDNFQRKLILSYLEQNQIVTEPGFDQNWQILMVAGHGGIGHLDIFKNDDTALDWYQSAQSNPLFQPNAELSFSLKEMLSWMDASTEAVLSALGPTPSVGGAVPKLLLAIPETGWDGRIALASKIKTAGQTDVVVKFEQGRYPGIVALEALALDIHQAAGFEVPRYWIAEINNMPVIAIERFDRTSEQLPLFTESLYSIMATGDANINNHYSSSYDRIIEAITRSPIDLVDDPRATSLEICKRLLLSFLTGNGDLHLENLSILIDEQGHKRLSPVYDPTPMRAYSQHDMLSVMPFGGYGEYDANDQLVGFEQALMNFAKTLNISKASLHRLIDEMLHISTDFNASVMAIESLPSKNRLRLTQVTDKIRQQLQQLITH